MGLIIDATRPALKSSSATSPEGSRRTLSLIPPDVPYTVPGHSRQTHLLSHV